MKEQYNRQSSPNTLYKNKEWMLKQKDAGYYQYQIAEMCGIQPCTMKKWAKRLGVKFTTGTKTVNEPKRIATGTKFGSITLGDFVKYATYKNTRMAVYKYICDCGNKGEANLHYLSKRICCGKCGNEKRKGLPIKKTIEQKDTMYKLLSKYKLDAKNRGLLWQLSKDQFRSLTSSNCHYCGTIPLNIKKTHLANYQLNEYIWNGIDRVDNNIGYVESNCVPCCTICNLAKRNLSIEVFNAWINNLVNYQNNLKIKS